jgi:hypothetical protein
MFGWLRRSHDQVALDAEKETAESPLVLLRHKHDGLLTRGVAVGLDSGTLLLLLQLFGPLAVALIELLIKRLSGR